MSLVVSTPTVPDLTAPADRLVTLASFPAGEIPTLGFAAADWAEKCLVQPNGVAAGRRFRFTPDQLNFLLWAYALNADGRWMFNHLVRRLAKGSGKSPFAAVCALIELLAPVRLERFDDRCLGGVRGRRVRLPWVQIAATAESQTKNTMRFVRAFCPAGGRLARDYRIDVGKTKLYVQPEGSLEQITSSYTAVEGAQATFVVADETEHWSPSNQGDELLATLADNLAKTGGRVLETANAWKPGSGSVAEATFDDWVAQEEGRLKGDQRILYDARMASADTDLADRESLRGALNDIYRFCSWIDVDDVIARIWRKSAQPDDSRRKFLNRPTEALDAWTAAGEWALLTDSSITVKPQSKITLFFDGSKSRDATAFVGCRMSDGHIFVPRLADGSPTVWEPNPAHDTDDVVDVAAVDEAARWIADRYRVVGFFADVAEWESFTKVVWPTVFDELQVMAQPSGRDPQPIAWDMRNHVFEFTRAVELTSAEIEDRAFTHDGHPVLGRHVANCRRHPNRYGISVRKASRSSPHKIDVAVAMIGARLVRRVVLAAKPAVSTSKRRPGKVW